MRTPLTAALALVLFRAALLGAALLGAPACADDAESGKGKTTDPLVGEWYILTEVGG